MTKRIGLAAALLLALAPAACQRGKRTLHEKTPMTSLPRSIAVGKLEAGPKSPPVGMANPYEDNAYAMTEGQRLYNWYGMPSWRGKIPEYQIWQIVTYVESLKGDRPIASPPGPRQEHLQAGEGRTSR
jgi:cytochrome c oxidase cbb3-type subunit III